MRALLENQGKCALWIRARLCHAVYAARRMSRPLLVRLSSALPLLPLLALLACKLGKDDEQSGRTLPAPEPASTTPPSRPVEADPPKTERPKESTPRPTSDETPVSPKPTSTSTTAPTAGDAAAPAPSASTATPSGGDKLNACISKCQAGLSACLAKPIPLDAGVPSLESMSECKKAFEDCRTACTP
jgi:hypothetical protein